MGGGADDLLARQASQPAYSLVQEGGELVGLDPVGLRPRVAQLGGFRIESKVALHRHGDPTRRSGTPRYYGSWLTRERAERRISSLPHPAKWSLSADRCSSTPTIDEFALSL